MLRQEDFLSCGALWWTDEDHRKAQRHRNPTLKDQRWSDARWPEVDSDVHTVGNCYEMNTATQPKIPAVDRQYPFDLAGGAPASRSTVKVRPLGFEMPRRVKIPATSKVLGPVCVIFVEPSEFPHSEVRKKLR